MSTLVVIRHVNERTRARCVALAQNLYSTVIELHETPFLKAVEKTFQIGADHPSYRFLLALDADVLLHETAAEDISKEWQRYEQRYPNLFRLDHLVQDKFRGRVYAGCHLYRNDYSQRFASFFASLTYDATQRRPESHNIVALVNRLGLKSKNAKKIVGIHDHEQYYRHIYAKYYNRAVRDYKHFDKIYNMIKVKREEYPNDYDFVIALKAMEDARNDDLATMNTDASTYTDISDYLDQLGLEEKMAL